MRNDPCENDDSLTDHIALRARALEDASAPHLRRRTQAQQQGLYSICSQLRLNAGCRYNSRTSVLVLDVVLLLQLRQLLFSTRKIGFGCRSVLFSRHMIQHDDIALLEMEAIEVV